MNCGFLSFSGRDRRTSLDDLRVIGLLKPGVSLAQGDAEIRALSLRAQQQYPATNSGVDAYAVGLNKDYTREKRTYISFVLGAVAFVLLIACANVANLLLARGAARQKELAVRMALGAPLAHHAAITDGKPVAGAGGRRAGSGTFRVGRRRAGQWHSAGIVEIHSGLGTPGHQHLALGFTILASPVTGVLCGLLPAWQATKADFNETMKEGSKGAAAGARNGGEIRWWLLKSRCRWCCSSRRGC